MARELSGRTPLRDGAPNDRRPGRRRRKAAAIAAAALVLVAAEPAASEEPIESAGVTAVGTPAFEANRGQHHPRVEFAMRGAKGALFLTAREAVLSMPSTDGRAAALGFRRPEVVRMRLAGARSAPRVEGVGHLPGRVNSFAGADPSRWRTGIPTFAGVRYERVYPGIDLVFHARGGALEYDFLVAAGARHEAIVLDFAGVDAVWVDAAGDLVLSLGGRQVRHRAPRAFERTRGGRRVVPVRFVMLGSRRVGFAVDGRDRRRALVIDPVLAVSTYLGGAARDAAEGVAVDDSGAAYATGWTMSADFPVAGALDGWQRDDECSYLCRDAWVAKLSPDGSRLAYSTYLSGGDDDRALDVEVDSTGAAYVTGYSRSTDFPTTPGAFQRDWRCGTTYGDVFVTKLAPGGSRLDYSTYVGGCRTGMGERGNDVEIDATGSAYVTGTTDSLEFPTTPGALKPRCAAASSGNCGLEDAFVFRLDPSGGALVWSTLFGGDGSLEVAEGLEIDREGRPVLAGTVYGAHTDDFPTTTGAFSREHTTFSDAFVARLDGTGSRLEQSTALGGVDWDRGADVAIGPGGDVYLAGDVQSDDFPTTPGAYDRVCNRTYVEYGCTNHDDGFVARFSPELSRLVYSTYLGGGRFDQVHALEVDGAGRAHATGYTGDFPTVGAFQTEERSGGDACDAQSWCSDAFIALLDAAGSALLGSSYLGGNSHDSGDDLALAPSGHAWVAGIAHSSDFPVAGTVPQPRYGGGNCDGDGAFYPCSDAFLAKIDAATPARPPTRTHARRISLGFRRGSARGRVRVLDGHAACVRRVPVLLERRTGSRWRRAVRTRTRSRGGYYVRAWRLRRGVYRVRAPRVRIGAHVCAGARSRAVRRR